MNKPGHIKAQAATELAVFGAVLIFILGSIVRSAVSNSYQQNQNFKAMRIALMDSWAGSSKNPGQGAPQDTSHNMAQILFIEDRLAPDFTKYGDIDRNPFIATGSGTFSYNLLYPITDSTDIMASLPIQDVYVNGVHFPFTMASYVPAKALPPPSAFSCPTYNGAISPLQQCLLDRCKRNKREWVGGGFQESLLNTMSAAPIPPLPIAATSTKYGSCAGGADAAQRACATAINACTIFTEMNIAGIITVSDPNFATSGCAPDMVATVNVKWNTGTPSPWATFQGLYNNAFSGMAATAPYLNFIKTLIPGVGTPYKLFYTMIPNPMGTTANSFNLSMPPSCSSQPCGNDEALSADLPLKDYDDAPTTDGYGHSTNANGVMQYDLSRNGNYYNSLNPTDNTSVYARFPASGCSSPTGCMRKFVAWQWAATAGTDAQTLGINTSNNQYPTYDVDGRLKEQTIFSISHDPTTGYTTVGMEDTQGGDIDQSWDSNTCGPKPGLQQQMQLFTFTSSSCASGVQCVNGTCQGTSDPCGNTYLRIKEGRLVDPENPAYVVRSVDKRDTIDLIQRTVQLSNNTGRFCTNPALTHNPPMLCTDFCQPVFTVPLLPGQLHCSDCAIPDSVEKCVDGVNNKCTDQDYIKYVCMDTSYNMIFVRSRLEDRRGHFWMTDTSGQLKVQ